MTANGQLAANQLVSVEGQHLAPQTAADYLRWRTAALASGFIMRLAGVADTSANYDVLQRVIASNNATPTVDSAFAQTSWATLLGANRAEKVYHFEIDGLNAATRTMIDARASGTGPSGGGNQASSIKIVATYRHRLPSAYNGIEFATTTGTITGTYIVEGVR